MPTESTRSSSWAAIQRTGGKGMEDAAGTRVTAHQLLDDKLHASGSPLRMRRLKFTQIDGDESIEISVPGG